MYTTIYIGEKPVILINNSDPLLQSYRHNPRVLLLEELSPQIFHTIIHEVNNIDIDAIVVCHEDYPTLKDFFFKHFMLIQAAGGVVQNEKGELLLIFRRGKWDLPKGKIDPDETPEQCALREVAEETGLQQVALESSICQTYHVYEEFGKKILKETFWYKMKSAGLQDLVPQTEEDIEAVRWIQKNEWIKYSDNTYASIHEVMNHYFK